MSTTMKPEPKNVQMETQDNTKNPSMKGDAADVSPAPTKTDKQKNADRPIVVGQTVNGNDLDALLKGELGQYEVTREGRTDRVTIVNDKVAFIPDIPEEYKKNDTGKPWSVRKISD